MMEVAPKRCKHKSPQLPTANLLMCHDGIPTGLCNSNNSCGYNAVIAIVYNLWMESWEMWSGAFDDLNTDYLGALSANFCQHEGSINGLEECCKILQQHLQWDSPHEIKRSAEINIHTLLQCILTTPSITHSNVVWCDAGHSSHHGGSSCRNCLFFVLNDHRCLQDFINSSFENSLSSMCHICNAHQIQKSTLICLPPLLAFDLSSCHGIDIDHHLELTANNMSAAYSLQGIIYYGHHHFTCRFVSQHGMVWYHCSIQTGTSLTNKGPLQLLGDLLRKGALKVTAVLYPKL